MLVYTNLKLLKLSHVELITFEILEKTKHKADFWNDRYFLIIQIHHMFLMMFELPVLIKILILFLLGKC